MNEMNWTFGSLIDSRFYIISMSFDFNEQFGAKSFGSSGYIEHLVQYLVPPCWFGTPEAEPPDVPAGFPSWCKHVPESVRGMVSQCPNVTSSIGGWTSMGEFLRVSPNIPIGFANVGGGCSCCTYMKKKGNGALPEHEVFGSAGCCWQVSKHEANRVLAGHCFKAVYLMSWSKHLFGHHQYAHSPDGVRFEVEWRSGNCGQCPHWFCKMVEFLVRIGVETL